MNKTNTYVNVVIMNSISRSTLKRIKCFSQKEGRTVPCLYAIKQYTVSRQVKHL